MIKKKPIIGITIDYIDPSIEEGGDWYSNYPWYAVRSKYLDIVTSLGGVPYPLYYSYELIPKYLSIIDGLMITGGGFDIDPKLYGVDYLNPKTNPKPIRNEFELKLVKDFLSTKKPILGICGGMQLINVLHGGTLFQDINDECVNSQNHVHKNPSLPHHLVKIIDDSLLHKIVGVNELATNTSHHQAVKGVGSGLVVNATSSDGIIEGIEDPTHPFCIGVQWHPEWKVSLQDTKIISCFIEKSLKNGQ
jgi:putative glutamine amidotransferase